MAKMVPMDDSDVLSQHNFTSRNLQDVNKQKLCSDNITIDRDATVVLTPAMQASLPDIPFTLMKMTLMMDPMEKSYLNQMVI